MISAEMLREAFTQAVRNVARYGDTDIFPHVFERHVFYDSSDKVIKALEDMHHHFFDKDASSTFSTYPISNVGTLSPVGHFGFRLANQLDPLWNAYLLGLCIAAAPAIEQSRVSTAKNCVFSYRFCADSIEGTLFDQNIGWRSFMEASCLKAQQHKYVLVCDIADFYPRVYHHRITNALNQVVRGCDVPRRIDEILIKMNPKGVSYGLPVGGPAARILAELTLNQADQLLLMHGIDFCRFVDDYHIFADSHEDAYKHLAFLSEKLLINQGLPLQKAKTRIVSSSEFIGSTRFALGLDADSEDGRGFLPTPEEHDLIASRFMKLTIQYDPYSEDPDGDYEETQKILSSFDIVGMLVRELEKSQIHGTLTKSLLKAVRFLSDAQIEEVATLLTGNIASLAPVFPHVMMVLRSIFGKLSSDSQCEVIESVLDLLQSESRLAVLELNQLFALRLVALRPVALIDRATSVCVSLFDRARGPASPLLRRDIILLMARWRNANWLSDTLTSFDRLSDWERRACIVASYALGDEGHHWRDQHRKALRPLEVIVRDWASLRVNNKDWEVRL